MKLYCLKNYNLLEDTPAFTEKKRRKKKRKKNWWLLHLKIL